MTKSKSEFTEYLAAISIGLFILAGGIAFMFYTKWKDADDKVHLFESQREVLTQHSGAIYYNVQKELEATTDQLNMVLDSNTISLNLNSLPIAPAASGKVFWNSTSKKVFLSVNNLPVAPDGMTYRLWAKFDGKHFDAGSLDLTTYFQKMNKVENIQSLFVTLEKKEGNISPSLDKIYLKASL